MQKGIDVSKHQVLIDWTKVKGIDFAVIRAGYGKSVQDEYFIQNINGALKAGLEVGVYWFLYCTNKEEAIQNAVKFNSVIASFKNKITKKVWCDFEYDSDRYCKDKGVTLSKKERTDIVKSFCLKMQAFGWDVGVYANPDYLENKFEDLSRFPLWLAWYSVPEEKAKTQNPFMWQYSDSGSMTGIRGNVDMNYCYEETKKPKIILTGYVGGSIVQALSQKGYDSSFKFRKELWNDLGQKEVYKGTAEQNHKMISLLGGKVQTDIPSLAGYKGFSIVDGLKAYGYPHDFEYRKVLWKNIGKTDTYKGTIKQNLTLLNTLKSS